jgi:hypothetical protein
MAQVRISVHQDIEKLLDLLLWQWGRLPAVEAEIDTWDLTEQLDFIEEWPLEEMRLRQLEHYVARDALTPEQLARYHDLKQLISKNCPIIRRLQAS